MRHDVAAPADEAGYPFLFPLYEVDCVSDRAATVVHPRWALTTAHCTDKLDLSARSGGAHAVRIAGTDNAVVAVAMPAEAGSIAQVQDADGRIVRVDESGFDDEHDDGVFRVATNRVVSVTPCCIVFNFDAPGSGPSIRVRTASGPRPIPLRLPRPSGTATRVRSTTESRPERARRSSMACGRLDGGHVFVLLDGKPAERGRTVARVEVGDEVRRQPAPRRCVACSMVRYAAATAPRGQRQKPFAVPVPTHR